MRLGIKAQLKHGALMEWRFRNGYRTIASACRATGIHPTVWYSVEALNFRKISPEQIRRLAEIVGIEPIDLVPPELHGKVLGRVEYSFRDVSPRQLMSAVKRQYYLPPDEAIDDQIDAEELLERFCGALTERELDVLKRRQRGDTLTTIAKSYYITRERVRTIECAALRKLNREADKYHQQCAQRWEALGGTAAETETTK